MADGGLRPTAGSAAGANTDASDAIAAAPGELRTIFITGFLPRNSFGRDGGKATDAWV